MIKTLKFDPTKPQLLWLPHSTVRTATIAELSHLSGLSVHASIPPKGSGGKTQWAYKMILNSSVVGLGGGYKTEEEAQIAVEQSLAKIIASLPDLEVIKTSEEISEVERSEIFRKVKEIIEDKLGLDPERGQVTEQSRLQEDLGSDSLDDVDLIILATTTPDKIFPSTACLLQSRLDIHGCAAFDIQAVCSGFVYALGIADKFIGAGTAKCA